MRAWFLLAFFLSSSSPATGADWSSRFGSDTLGNPGLDEPVYTLATDGSTVYAGGGFYGVYRWNDPIWTRVGYLTPLADDIWSLTVTSNHDIYAGGQFATVAKQLTGPMLANHIVRWDGSDWVPLVVDGLVGFDSPATMVQAMATAPNGTDVFVGGLFTMAGGMPRNYVTLWDGSTWQMVAGNTFDDRVYDIQVEGNDVYFAGSFTQPSPAVAHFDGVSFEDMGSAALGTAYTVAVYNGEIYAAGSFPGIGSGGSRVIRWDGTNWQSVTTTVTSNGSPPFGSMTRVGSSLYLGGRFSEIDGVAVNNVARWDGGQWSSVGLGASSWVFASANVDDQLWVGGEITTAGGGIANNVARWNGTWGFGGANQVVRDITPEGDGAVAVGDFTTAGGVAANRVARWNDGSWSALGSGVGGSARCVASDGTNVYVGGAFTTAGGTPAAGLARWDGSTWSELGGGVQGIPYDLALDGGDLYVVGAMATLSPYHPNLARWDGTAWSQVGDSGYPTIGVRCVTVSGGKVYIGGDFNTIGGGVFSHIAVWDGVWLTLGAGLNGIVYDIAAAGSNVYVAGDFTASGSLTVNGIARWNGLSWSALGAGVDGTGRSVEIGANGYVYLGGDYSTAGAVVAPNLAQFNQSGWSAVGGGADDRVLAMAATSGGVWAGGDFLNLGTTSSTRVGFWDYSPPTAVDAPATTNALVQNYPNPFNPSTRIRYTLVSAGRTTLRIYDVRGGLVRTLVDEAQTAGAHSIEWDGRNNRGVQMASGTYFCRLEANGASRTRKLTLLK